MTITVPVGSFTPVWYADGFKQCHLYVNRAQSDSNGELIMYLTDDGTTDGDAIFSYRPTIAISAEGDGYIALISSLSSDLTTLTIKTYQLLAPVTVAGGYQSAGGVYVNVIAVGR